MVSALVGEVASVASETHRLSAAREGKASPELGTRRRALNAVWLEPGLTR